MTTKWELCYLKRETTPFTIVFCRPGKELESIDLVKYANSLGMKKKGYGFDWDEIYPHLLDDGWEPFSTSGQFNNIFAFRRKLGT